jgi:Flp pilus assembly protein TadG
MSDGRAAHPFDRCTSNSVFSALTWLVWDCSGAAAAEFLIVLFPLLLLFLGTFDIGIAMLTVNRINFAAEAAAKCGAIGAGVCASPSQTAAYGASIAALRGLDASSFLVTTAECGMYVTVTYPYAGVVLPVITLRAGACYPTG